MTGQNSARHRTTNWISAERNNRTAYGPSEWNWLGEYKNAAFLPRLLKKAGYFTIHAGKAHFGPNGAVAEIPSTSGLISISPVTPSANRAVITVRMDTVF